MARKKKINTKKQIYNIGVSALLIIKYFTLVMTVAYIGAFIASGIVFMVRGNELTVETQSKLMALITYYTSSEATSVITSVGMGRCKIALLLYSFIYSIKYGIMYVLVSRFTNLFRDILNNKMFTTKNVEMIGNSLPLALILAFAQPVLMAFTIIGTHAYLDFEAFDFSGILYLFVVVLLYMIFASGYDMEKEHEKFDEKLEDYRAEVSDSEIEKLKKKIDEKNSKIKEEKVEEKKVEIKEEKVEEKKEEKVEETTEEPAKKKRRRRKKTSAKKATK